MDQQRIRNTTTTNIVPNELSAQTLPRHPERQAAVEVIYKDGSSELHDHFGRKPQADFAFALSELPEVERVVCHFPSQTFEREKREQQDSQEPTFDPTAPKGYRWPASRLSSVDMDRLCELRKVTGLPLTRILQDAIAAYYNLTVESQIRQP